MARDITVKFKGDASDLEGDARRAAGAMDKFGDAQKRATDSASGAGGKLGGLKGALGSLGGVAKIAAGNMVSNLAGTAATAVTQFVGDSIEAASRLQQAQGGVDAVFGKSAGVVSKYASTSADRLGLAGAEYRELATVAGAQLKNAGQSTDEAAKSTDGLITKAADLSATFGGSTKDAMEAISSLMKGETDPIEKYGVSIKQTDINARLAAEGQDKLTGAAKKSAEAQARLALLTEQTTDATGAFGRESDTLAGKQQRANAKMEDAKAKLGEALLPAMTAVTGFMADTLVPGMIAAGESIGKVVGWLVESLGPAFTTIGGYIAPVIETLQKLWDMFGPVIMDQVTNVFNTIKGVIESFFMIIKGIFDVFAGLFTGDWTRVWEGIKGIFSGAFNYLKTLVMYFVNSLKNIFTGLWAAITAIFKGLWNSVSGVVKSIWDDVSGAFRRGIDQIVTFVTELPGKALSALSSLGTTLWNAAKGAFSDMLRAVGNGIADIITTVRDLPNKVWRAIGNLYDKAWHIGADLVRGIGNGISHLLGWLIDKATEMATAPVRTIKNILHIGSPSKVMEDIGRDTVRGFAQGIEKEGPTVQRAVLAGPIKAAQQALTAAYQRRSEAMRRFGTVRFEDGSVGPRYGTVQGESVATAKTRLENLMRVRAAATARPASYSSVPAAATRSAAPSAGAMTVNVMVTPMSNPVEAGRAAVEAIQSYERLNGTKWRQTA